AHIVDRSIADDVDGTGFGVDFDLADLRAVGEARDGEGLVGDTGERSLQFRRQVGARRCGGDLEDADLAIGAGNTEPTALEHDVDLAGFEQKAGDFAALGDDVVRRLAYDRRGDLHRATGREPPPATTRAVSWAT